MINNVPRYSFLSLAFLVLCGGLFLSFLFLRQKPAPAKADSSVVRGQAYDKWADVVIGKRDFTEITDNKTTANRVMGGGVAVDDRTDPGFAYIWDAMHSRIVGVNLADCYALPTDTRCTATFVIGQPSLDDWGACNRDGSFQFYPERSPSSAETLCSIPEWTFTSLEDKSYTSMFLDADYNLWVFDTQNNRVLKFIDPVNTDSVADDVWGQTDFIGNKCNLTAQWPNVPPQPTASSLCFWTIAGGGAGVTLDASGNLWVADGGNNRVLRFPKDVGTGIISKTADVVLGQANFTTGGDWSNSADTNRMWGPSVVRFGSDGKLYVLDDGNSRILRFSAPYSDGMTAEVFMDATDFPNGVSYLEMDPTGNYFWTGQADGGPNTDFKKWALDGTYQNVTFQNWLQAAGSIGFDNDGNILIPDGDVVRYLYDSGTGGYSEDKYFFRYWEGTGERVANRLEQGGWGGIIFKNNQLVVVDGRILFWDNPSTVSNGQTPSGYVGSSDVLTTNNYIDMTADDNNHIYVQQGYDTIKVFAGPLVNGASATQTISSPFNVLGGGQIDISFISGLAASANSEYLWISDADNSRIIRVQDPLTAPLVDVVLGQTDISGTTCNRGIVPERDPGVQLDMICRGGSLTIDKLGNLFVSDNFFEAVGNFRVLMFSADTFPAAPSSVLFAPDATKEFPYPANILSTSFDSTNRMIGGYNPYVGRRFVDYWDDPTAFNPLDPSDTDFAAASGQLEDFYGWAFASAFDDQDNLYMYDSNRGKVLLYLQPFGTPASPTPTPSPTPSSTPAPSSNSGGGNSSEPPTAPNCTAEAPSNAPNFFQVNYTTTTATLFFTPVTPADAYFIAYGFTSGDKQFGTSVAGNSNGVISYTINDLAPGKEYYFSVRGQNECKPGQWSNERHITTKKLAVGGASANIFNAPGTESSPTTTLIESPTTSVAQDTVVSENTFLSPEILASPFASPFLFSPNPSASVISSPRPTATVKPTLKPSVENVSTSTVASNKPNWVYIIGGVSVIAVGLGAAIVLLRTRK